MKIKEIIKAHGFTLEQVAQRMPNSKTNGIGITKQSMSLIVKEDSNPQISTLRSIASIIGCEVGDFFEDETNKHNSLVCPKCGAKLKLIEE